jgi:hypothetical protein
MTMICKKTCTFEQVFRGRISRNVDDRLFIGSQTMMDFDPIRQNSMANVPGEKDEWWQGLAKAFE